jgi:hypothetical protein
VSAVDTLVAFYDIHGRKGEVLFLCPDPDTTRDIMLTAIRDLIVTYCIFKHKHNLKQTFYMFLVIILFTRLITLNYQHITDINVFKKYEHL